MPDPVPLNYQPTPRKTRGRSEVSLTQWLIRVASVLAVLVLVGWLLCPRLCQNTETVGRASCSNNLRQIGLGCLIYAGQWNHAFPDTLANLLVSQGFSTIDVAVCPASKDRVPPGKTLAQQVVALSRPGCCSYIYVGGGLSDSSGPDAIVAFDDPANHDMSGANILYGDAHVSFEYLATVVQLVSELEAGRNPPTLATLTPQQATTIYNNTWKPRLAAMKTGTWAPRLPRPATQPITGQ